METTAPVAATFPLPFRLGFAGNGARVAKRSGMTDAGWTVQDFRTVEDRDAFMVRHVAAAMPCWTRIVPGVA